MRERPKNWRPGRQQSDPARSVVFEVLMDVEVNGAYANIALPRAIREARLGKQDAAYATNLTYGTLRMQGRWDAILMHCMDRQNIDAEARVLLRMGAHQLLDMGTPPHAAIHETVMLARNKVGTGVSGFVNAVLRRVSERSLKQWQEQLISDHGKVNTVGFLAAWFSHPQWIVRALSASLREHGRSHKDLISVLRAHNEPAEVALVARDIPVPELMADISRGKMSSRPGELVDTAVLLEGGDPGRIFAVQDGYAGVQDEGSQLVARTFAAAEISGPDSAWLDMCAGPGGKTATLAALNPRVDIFANEIHAHRLDLVRDSVAPWADQVHLRLGDGVEIGMEEPGRYDRVLIDAPCTGIGALRRRPEARWNKEAGDALDLVRTQLSLLESGWEALRPGGVLGYATCSPYLAETTDVMDTFLAGRADAVVLNANEIANGQSLKKITGTGDYLQLWPDEHKSDAMFLALVRKAEG
ncbi:RsmB/NOP family class I SAM-dependent RNA methyltransferase [Trueperella bialowiezensis]|uniref:Ribosomal RNA small subunit methyltransferase B n=1 Tax=Trueperella bialowiezensis TaxID=312285 RepID=A0A3S4V9B0_9ACTO|nr:transcription antitermination factor NusB [Trueperella bialowiezensis]VEI12439.1 Ribosomal RNA small subunit methyltransferase B [Trueperella bialowiezensis]